MILEFWKRYSFVIMNTPEGLGEFEEYQIDISWLKDYEIVKNDI
jgi:hypothetical protein